MNERTTLEIIAPTVEEALAQGLSELGLPADAVSVEVLDSGKKGPFGLGPRQVRVRLTVNPRPGVMAAMAAPAMPAPVAEPPVRKAAPKPSHAAAEPAPRAQQAVGRREPRPKPAATPEASAANGNEAMLDTTEAVVSKLLHHLGLQAQVSAHFDEASEQDRQRIHVDVRGEDLGALIGRRGETLNAFQYVASLMVGKEAQQWAHLIVDVEGYRSRRENQLRQLANRMAEQVIKSGKKAALEPMSASERRIIHLELRGHPAVTTESVGEEPFRKVTIVPKE